MTLFIIIVLALIFVAFLPILICVALFGVAVTYKIASYVIPTLVKAPFRIAKAVVTEVKTKEYKATFSRLLLVYVWILAIAVILLDILMFNWYF